MDGLPALTAAQAEAFATTALANVVQEYPHKLDHVMGADADVLAPRALHPAFYGSYDWHSCVHMHWLLVHVWRIFPKLAVRESIAATLDRHLSAETIAAECAYLDRPHTQSFERTYGWAWLLKLATELELASAEARARPWESALAPLTERFVQRYLRYLPRALYPIRYGMHPNSAFGLAFARDYALTAGHRALASACDDAARRWFELDRDAPTAWEPSGADFLSPALMEAELMRRVLSSEEYAAWLDRFLPGLGEGRPESLLVPAKVTDRTDPQIVHLDGLNLSRAWCWRGLAWALTTHDPRRLVATEAAAVHLDAGVAALAGADYVASHWLASFAVLALTPAESIE